MIVVFTCLRLFAWILRAFNCCGFGLGFALLLMVCGYYWLFCSGLDFGFGLIWVLDFWVWWVGGLFVRWLGCALFVGLGCFVLVGCALGCRC